MLYPLFGGETPANLSMENAGHLRALNQLIERLTDRRGSEQSIESLRKLKRACKVGGDATITATFTALMEKVKDQHAKVALRLQPATRFETQHTPVNQNFLN